MNQKTIDEALLDAVFAHDAERVQQCLVQGANPNYAAPTDGRGDPLAPQPDTPLKAVVFCLSDAQLDDGGLACFEQIAARLITAGADPLPAAEMAEQRYGRYQPDMPPGPFNNIRRLIHEAARQV